MRLDYLTMVEVGDLGPESALAEIRLERAKLIAQACDTLKLPTLGKHVTINDLRTACKLLGFKDSDLDRITRLDKYLESQERAVQEYSNED